MDLASIQTTVASRLPAHARWLINETPQDFSFYKSPRNLATVMAQELLGDVLPGASDYIAFGEYDVAKGGGANGWLVVGKSDGRVFGVDVERKTPVSALNSSLEAFVETFLLLDTYLRHALPVPTDLDVRIHSVDPTTYPVSEWKTLAEYLTTS